MKKKTRLIDDPNADVRVCAYCRVSSDKKDQLNSLEVQEKFFKERFKDRANWSEIKVFSDEGISGTSTKNRKDLNEMLERAKSGEFNLVITKDVSRFARNVQDALNLISEAIEKGVRFWFLTDDLYSEDEDFREGLIELSHHAEKESARLSKKVKFGHEQRMLQGVTFGRKEMYGYNIVKDEFGKQHYEIIPDEAEVIKKVFTMYANGHGTFQIARTLDREGIPTKRYKNGWSNIVILRMLRNEKYVGDLTVGKTYTPNYLNHKKVLNDGSNALRKTHTNHHPESAIIDRELWDRVQFKLGENALPDEVKAKHSNRYWCSGKVICGECGERFVSHIRHLKKGGIYKCWKCWQSQQYGSKNFSIDENGKRIGMGCKSESVNDRVLREGMKDIIDYYRSFTPQTLYNEIEETYKKNLKKEDDDSIKQKKKLEKSLELCNNRINVLYDKWLDGKVSDEQKEEQESRYSSEKKSIEEQLKTIVISNDPNRELTAKHKENLATIKKILELNDEEINDDLYKVLIDKIEVYNDHILKYYFKAFNKPITMQYKATGRTENYKVEFMVIPNTEKE